MRAWRCIGWIAALLLAAPVLAGDIPELSAEALAARIAAGDERLLILDVRTPGEYAAGHVPGAINIPHDEVPARSAGLRIAEGTDLVVYCRSGKRAALALAALERAGFKRLLHLEGDYLGWSEGDRPIATPVQP